VDLIPVAVDILIEIEDARAGTDLITKYPAYGGSFSDREIAPYR